MSINHEKDNYYRLGVIGKVMLGQIRSIIIMIKELCLIPALIKRIIEACSIASDIFHVKDTNVMRFFSQKLIT